MSSHNIVAVPPYTFRLRLAQFIIAFLVLILDVSSSLWSANDSDDDLRPTKDLCPSWVIAREQRS